MAERNDKQLAEDEIDTVVDSTMANSTGSEGYKGGVAGAPTSAAIRQGQSQNQYPNPGGASAGATTRSGEGISSTDNETDSGVSAASDDYGDPTRQSPYLDSSASGDVGGRLTTPDTQPITLQPDDIDLRQIGNLSERGFSGGAGTPAPNQSGGTTGGASGSGATAGGVVQPGRADRGSLGVTTEGGTTGFGTTNQDVTNDGLATNAGGEE